MNLSAFRVPGAWVPLAMSGLAFALVAGHVLTSGSAPGADEGAAAHAWQLLMVGQVPLIGWFALRSFARRRVAALPVLAVQAAAVALAAAPVALLGL